MHVERIADRFHALCSCGWFSRFYMTREKAEQAWEAHRR